MDEKLALSLDDMKREAEEAVSFLDGVSEADFYRSAQRQKACAMCIIIIAEAAARIEQTSPGFVAAHPEWPWKEIRGMRNIIAHNYARLHLPTIWTTVRDSLPDLLAKIESLGEIDPRSQP